MIYLQSKAKKRSRQMQIWPLLRLWGCPSKKTERFSLLFLWYFVAISLFFSMKGQVGCSSTIRGLGSLPVARVVAEHAMDIAAVNISTCSFTLILMLIWMSQCFVKMNISTIFTWHPKTSTKSSLRYQEPPLAQQSFFSAMDVHSSEVGWWLLARYCLGVQADWLKESKSER